MLTDKHILRDKALSEGPGGANFPFPAGVKETFCQAEMKREGCLPGRESGRTHKFHMPGTKLERSTRPRQIMEGSQGRLRGSNSILQMETSHGKCSSWARLEWRTEGRWRRRAARPMRKLATAGREGMGW